MNSSIHEIATFSPKASIIDPLTSNDASTQVHQYTSSFAFVAGANIVYIIYIYYIYIIIYI